MADYGLFANGVIGDDYLSVLKSKIQSTANFYHRNCGVLDWGHCGDYVAFLRAAVSWPCDSRDWDRRHYAIGLQYYS